MAVNISSKNSLNGKSFVELLGFAEEAKTLEDEGWQFKLTAKDAGHGEGSVQVREGPDPRFPAGVAARLASRRSRRSSRRRSSYIAQALAMAG